MRKLIAILTLCIAALTSVAQISNHNLAVQFYETGQFDSARVYIDQAVHHKETKDHFKTWLVRAAIYKEIYKTQESEMRKSPAREESIRSIMRCFELDSTSAFAQLGTSVKYLASTYYGNADEYLRAGEFSKAEFAFNKFKELMILAEPDIDLRDRDIEFYLALGTAFENKYFADKNNRDLYLSLAEAAYLKVLTIEPENYTANFNLGILFYNEGATPMIDMNFPTLEELQKIQDNSQPLFRKALPYAEKAYNLKPERKETVQALAGIYLGLNRLEKFELFQQKLKQFDE